MMIRYLLAALLSLALPAQAIVVAQWNFNSSPPDDNPSTGTAQAAVGSGSIGFFGFASFLFGNASGSTDPALVDNSGLLVRPFPAQGTGSQAAGLQLAVSTLGYRDVRIAWNQRNAAAASRFLQIQISTDGVSFSNVAGGLFEAVLGADAWHSFGIDLTGVAGVDNNALFAVRIAPVFAPGTQVFLPTDPGGTYGSNGAIGFDMLSMTASAVPEPAPWLMLLAGVGMAGGWQRVGRRHPIGPQA